MKQIIKNTLVLLTTSLVLLACSDSSPQTRGFCSKCLEAVSLQGPLINASLGNCPVDNLDATGEGYRIKGSTGGIAVKPYPSTEPVASIADAAKQILPNGLGKPVRSVALLIVDDFNGDSRRAAVSFLDQEPGDRLLELDSLLAPSSDLDTLALAQDTILDSLENAGQLSHGAMVMNHALRLLQESAGQDFSLRSIRGANDTAVFDFGKAELLVMAVDTDDFDTSLIAARISDSISALASQKVSAVVANLSFSVIPCSIRADFEATSKVAQVDGIFLTFEAYLEWVAAANGVELARFRQDLVAALMTPVNPHSDPLHLILGDDNDFVKQYPHISEAVFIAAAGNHFGQESSYPARWPEFVSVSSANVLTGVKSSFSNKGSVMIAGSYFELDYIADPINPQNLAQNAAVSYAGSSYAAPGGSAYSAVDLMQETPRCIQDTLRGPTLGLPKFVLPGSSDVPLEEAINLGC